MTDKQLIEDLITAMEYHVEQTRPVHMTTVAIQAAKDALKAMSATPVQEPDHSDELTIAYMSGVHRGKELAAQRQWVGLTDEEIVYAYTLEKKFAMQYVDAKLKEKNNG